MLIVNPRLHSGVPLMKSKALFWVPGAIALILAAAPALPPFSEAAIAGPGRMGDRSGKLEQLNLTEAQKTEMTRIRENTRQQMQAVFTPEQQAQMRQAREQRQRPDITLTDAQKTQLRAIHEESRRQMQSVLTEQQQQQLEQMRSNRPQRGPQSQRSEQWRSMRGQRNQQQ